MRYTSYYVIWPKNTLIDRLSTEIEDMSILFAGAVVWSKQEGGITPWMSGDYLIQIKVLFVLDLWNGYVKTNTINDASLFIASLLGEPPFDVHIFDKWWHIERNIGIEEFEDVYKKLPSEDYTAILPTESSLVNSWLVQRQESD